MQRASLASPDKRIAQNIGQRLKNLLKLPQARKWVCCEWFYADIDRFAWQAVWNGQFFVWCKFLWFRFRPVFEAENDFNVLLRESFPELKSRKLTRTEWCKIRRLLGKPRRWDAAAKNFLSASYTKSLVLLYLFLIRQVLVRLLRAGARRSRVEARQDSNVATNKRRPWPWPERLAKRNTATTSDRHQGHR